MTYQDCIRYKEEIVDLSVKYSDRLLRFKIFCEQSIQGRK